MKLTGDRCVQPVPGTLLTEEKAFLPNLGGVGTGRTYMCGRLKAYGENAVRVR